MKELLFGNLVEKEALENLLAFNQIKKCDEKIEKYKLEIEEQKEEMINILKDEDIDETCVEKIHKYKHLINNLDGDNVRINELEEEIKNNEERINEFQNKIFEIENEVENLKKEIFETNDPSKVIECQNELESKNVRLNDLNDILNGLISDNTPLLIEREYLAAKNGTIDFNIPTYNKNDISNDLDKLTIDFNETIDKLDLPIRENIEFCQKKISNRELEIEKYTKRKNSIIEAYPNAVGLDLNKAYSDLDNLFLDLGLTIENEVINNKNIFDEEEIEDNSLEDDFYNEEDKNSIKLDDEKNNEEVYNIPIETDKESIEENSNIEIDEDKTEEDDKGEDIESVSYELSDGESLSIIAEKVYPSKDNWEAIYYFNKDLIDKYLLSNGISNDFETIKELALDTSLFAGLKLEIPTDYNYKI